MFGIIIIKLINITQINVYKKICCSDIIIIILITFEKYSTIALILVE